MAKVSVVKIDYAEFHSRRKERQRLEKRCWGIQGGMTPWSEGEAREGEAASPEDERWKGEVSSPSKMVREWRIKSDRRESAS